MLAARTHPRRDPPHTCVLTRVCTHSPAQTPQALALTHSCMMHHVLVQSRTYTTAPHVWAPALAPSRAAAVAHSCSQGFARPRVHSPSLVHAGATAMHGHSWVPVPPHAHAPTRMHTSVPLSTTPCTPVLARPSLRKCARPRTHAPPPARGSHVTWWAGPFSLCGSGRCGDRVRTLAHARISRRFPPVPRGPCPPSGQRGTGTVTSGFPLLGPFGCVSAS